MGKVLGFIGRASKATDMYHRAITILESSCGAESEQLVVPLFALGNLLIKEGKATDAEKTFVRLLFFHIACCLAVFFSSIIDFIAFPFHEKL